MMKRIELIAVTMAMVAGVACAVGVPVDSVTVLSPSGQPGPTYSKVAELQSITVGGMTTYDFIAPDTVWSSARPAGNTGHLMYYGSDDPAPPSTLPALLLNTDITTGVLNPTTNSGVIDLVFPQQIGNLNGAAPDLFLFNIDNPNSTENWLITPIIGGSAGSPTLASTSTTFLGTDMGNTGVDVVFNSNVGHTAVTQGNWGIAFDLAELGVTHLTGVRIASSGADPSVIVGTPDPNVVLNGDFETNDPTADFPTNWHNPHRAIEHRGLTPTGLDAPGTNAAYLPAALGQSNGYIDQGVVVGPEWQFDMLFAAEAPPSNRSLNLLLRNDGNSGQINLRVVPGGDIQVYDSGWHTLAAGVVDFSVDGNADNDFEDELDDVLNVHSLRVVGNYRDSTPYYDVYLSDVNTAELRLIASNVSWFQTADPVAGLGPYSVLFQTGISDADYVVDNVRLVNIPEPATFSLLALGALGLVRRRRNG